MTLTYNLRWPQARRGGERGSNAKGIRSSKKMIPKQTNRSIKKDKIWDLLRTQEITARMSSIPRSTYSTWIAICIPSTMVLPQSAKKNRNNFWWSWHSTHLESWFMRASCWKVELTLSRKVRSFLGFLIGLFLIFQLRAANLMMSLFLKEGRTSDQKSNASIEMKSASQPPRKY